MLLAGVLAAYEGAWSHPVTFVDAGMEDMLSAYVLLDVAGTRLVLLERRNDDGEWAPLLYDTDLGPAPSTAEVFEAMARVEEYADELRYELEEMGLVDDVQSDALEGFCRDALYGVRDLISPHALD